MKYELTQHAREALSERDISTLWLERVLQSPERTEPDKQDAGLTHHLGKIAEYGNRVLRVVTNDQTVPARVVTVYFDRKMKGKL